MFVLTSLAAQTQGYLFFEDNVEAKQGSKYLAYCQKRYYGRQDI